MWWDGGESLDYVVFGIGFGATILVLGLLVRDIGPRLRYRKPSGEDGVFHAEELVAKVSWGRFCSALGAVLAILGMLFLLTTVVCMVLRLSDETGGWVMLGALAILVLLIAYWTWAFFDRFGSYGILPERQEEPEPAPLVQRPTLSERRPVPRNAPSAGNDRAASAEGAPDREAAETAVTESSADGDTPDADIATEETAPTSEPETSSSHGEGEDTPREPESGDDEADSSPLETPEERLAHLETPLDHGSAEGDLDIAAGGPRRPVPRPPRPSPQVGRSPQSNADPVNTSGAERPADGDEEGPTEDREQEST